ncbi:MAG: aminotransferase class I and II [Ignavibacteriales bacterium]|nr:MAG: aminotransferase class I and II [Ignavibacteriales bacterium]
MRKVTATRYVTPLREGGSLPAIIEADDDGLYVLKFRGAGQGAKALIAELVSGEIGRTIGLPVPEIVLVELSEELARTEADPEIQDLIKASGGLNLALDYLPGAVMFSQVADNPGDKLASSVVWFDAYITNVDRTIRNPNILVWHKKLYLIDHGASLYFHHTWDNYIEKTGNPFKVIKDHVLLPFADSFLEVDKEMKSKITKKLIEDIINQIPDSWLTGDSAFSSINKYKEAYIKYLSMRLQQSHLFVEEAIRARSIYI